MPRSTPSLTSYAAAPMGRRDIPAFVAAIILRGESFAVPASNADIARLIALRAILDGEPYATSSDTAGTRGLTVAGWSFALRRDA